MDCSSKRIYAFGLMAYISWFGVALPYITLLVIIILHGIIMACFIPAAFALSYLFYYIIGISGIGYVSIGKRIKCPRDWTPTSRFCQGKLDFPIDDVFGIEFKRMDGNSEGYLLPRMWDFTFLVFYLKDGSTKALYLNRFSTKQYLEIQSELLKRKPDILLFCSAQDFLKLFKY